VETGGANVVARAGTATVTADDVRYHVSQLSERDQAALARDPRLLSQAVRSILANRLALQEALEKKWDQQPETAAQLERVRQNAIVETYLRSVSGLPAGFPSQADIESLYETNKSAFVVPRQFQLAQIVVSLPQVADKDAEAKARKKLDEVLKKVKTPDADFAALAAAESDDREGAARGGDLGWLPENQMRPEIRAQIMGLAVKAVGEPVKLDDGWHVIKLIDTKPARTLALPEVRDQLVQRVRDERATANRRNYLAKLIDQTPPAINELALSALLTEESAKK
jgi:peptidylprolyl isomerase